MSMSAAGLQTLAVGEGLGGAPGNPGGHYNDSANNRTVEIGTLMHYGRCSAAETAQRADANANNTAFNRRVRHAEDIVRGGVNGRQLNQNQYDALVSAAYNSDTQLAPAMRAANHSDDTGVAVHLRLLVMVHNRDAHGHVVGPPVVSHGLVNRRAGEVTQYNAPVPPAPTLGQRR